MGNQFDIIIIGAGPGGYVTAIKAAQLGFKTAIIEEIRVGGTCLNRGCIPAKAMLHAASLYSEMKDGERFGILSPDVTYDYKKILSYKEETTDKLCQGVEQLLKANKVTVLSGRGRLEQDGSVCVTSKEGEKKYQAKHVVLATGSTPILLPLPGFQLPGVLTSDEVFQLTEVPESLMIVGGGVIGVEFATIFSSLGCKVTIVEAMSRLVPNLDKEISQNLKMILKRKGVEIHTSVAVQKVESQDNLYTCTFLEKEKEVQVSAQYVLCAVGRRPYLEGLLGEGVNLSLDKGRIKVDEHFGTSREGVYAIGDIIKGAQLAHVASAQGIYLAEELAGKKPTVDLRAVPSCVYTNPEIAAVGLSEEDAKDKGIEIKTGKFIMSANCKSLITKEERGFIKVVADAGSEVILGAQMMCARATDMIGEFGTAVANGLTVHQLLKTMRAHPTYNEGVAEALEDVIGGAIHIAPKK
ncbi:MAG: dihydrolipoyl dehydrogenase [Muricomes sp.]